MAIELDTISSLGAHDESDIYGVDSNYFYSEGDIATNPKDAKSILVTTRVGGLLYMDERKGVITQARASVMYPRSPAVHDLNGSTVLGILETEGLPSEERLKEFTLELAQLACGETVSPVAD